MSNPLQRPPQTANSSPESNSQSLDLSSSGRGRKKFSSSATSDDPMHGSTSLNNGLAGLRLDANGKPVLGDRTYTIMEKDSGESMVISDDVRQPLVQCRRLFYSDPKSEWALELLGEGWSIKNVGHESYLTAGPVEGNWTPILARGFPVGWDVRAEDKDLFSISFGGSRLGRDENGLHLHDQDGTDGNLWRFLLADGGNHPRMPKQHTGEERHCGQSSDHADNNASERCEIVKRVTKTKRIPPRRGDRSKGRSPSNSGSDGEMDGPYEIVETTITKRQDASLRVWEKEVEELMAGALML